MAENGKDTIGTIQDPPGDVTANTTEEEEEDVVDPWTVSSKSEKGVDYDKLIRKFC